VLCGEKVHQAPAPPQAQQAQDTVGEDQD